MKKLLIVAISLMVIGMIGMAVCSMMFGFGSSYGQYNHNEVLTDEYQKVAIDVNTLMLDVKQSDDNKTHIDIKHAKNENQIKYTVKDDTLYISGGESSGIDVDFNFGFNQEQNNMKVILHLPQQQYDEFMIESNVGEINIDKLDAKLAKFDMNVGEINVEEMNADDIQFSVDVGELTLRNVDKDANIKGDVNVGDASIYYKEKPDNVNVTTDSNMGDVELNDAIPKGGTVGKGEHTIDLETDMGDLTVDIE
ncbi:DUF4097 domain-containing protein [Macrococcoides bohemicum]|uniref:DUF4097 family beta strand repeat-containing protein n=1 Tax=Macrococcoides bohemicum TaxID=1903056 RepID=UPI001C5D1C1C|nr:DUF4097 family beta strand repeat-containing protein [Macrococcus bohemicus]QYA44447.1 DUF4097 domain-containing protein [Macrococcus bohemicus]